MSGAEGTVGHMGATVGPRFLSIKVVAEELAVGEPSVRTLIKTGDLPAIQIGGFGASNVPNWRPTPALPTQSTAVILATTTGNRP